MRVRHVIAVVIVVVLLAFAARAASAQAPGQVAAQPARPAASASRKSPAAAIGMSLGVYLVGAAIPPAGVPAAVVSLGLQMVGPSLGHFYAGRVWTTGLGLRLGGLATAAIGVALYVQNRTPCSDWVCVGFSPSNGVGSLGVAMLLVGATGILVGAIHDIATAGRDARDYNRRHGLDVTVAPAPIRAANSTAPGLALVGRF